MSPHPSPVQLPACPAPSLLLHPASPAHSDVKVCHVSIATCCVSPPLLPWRFISTAQTFGFCLEVFNPASLPGPNQAWAETPPPGRATPALYPDQAWVKYVIVLDSNTFLCFTELVWWAQTDEIISKSANWPSWLAQLHQAGSIEQRKVFESKTITYLTQNKR